MRLLMTGLSRSDLARDGDTEGVGRACYLCKRREGEESVVLEGEADGAPRLAFRPVEIDELTWAMESEEGEEVELVFPVCAECQVLLGLEPFGEEGPEEGYEDWP